MDPDLILRWLHVIGACVLLGTCAGIAIFMLMAHRTADARVIAHTAGIVLLARRLGWSLSEGWIAISLLLYILTGLFWLPVVWIQIRLRDYARKADLAGATLPSKYYKLFRTWFVCGIPAFAAVLAIPWLMLARPHILLF